MRLLLSILLTLILPLTTLAGGELKSNSITIEHDVGRSLPSGNPITAFGDLRVTNLSPIFQGSFEYTVDNTDLNTNTVANGGTVTQASAMAIVGTSTTTTSTALFQTKQHAKYRPGLGAVLRFTALFTTCTTGTEQYIGLADEVGSSAAFKNGYMIGCDGDTFGFHRFQNDVKFTTPLTDWDDPLDGSGLSSDTVTLTNLNVFFIEFQYLGAGHITIWREDSDTGKFIIVHTEQYAGLNTTPSVFNPNFFHTMWVANKATSINIILKGASYGFFIEGTTLHQELHQPLFSSGSKEKTSITTEVAILTIRNKVTYVGKTNFIDIILHEFLASIEASSANNLGTVRVLRNATLGGTPSFSDINTSNSVVEIDTAGTTISGGIELFTIPLAGKNDAERENIIDHTIVVNPGDTITLSGSSVASATIRAGILWKELF